MKNVKKAIIEAKNISSLLQLNYATVKIAHEENKFTIRNFDKWISAAVVKRGKQYTARSSVPLECQQFKRPA